MSILFLMSASNRIWERQWAVKSDLLSFVPQLGPAATLSIKHPSFGLRKFGALFYFLRFTSSLVHK